MMGNNVIFVLYIYLWDVYINVGEVKEGGGVLRKKKDEGFYLDKIVLYYIKLFFIVCVKIFNNDNKFF